MSDHYFEFKNVCKAFDDNAVLKDVSFFGAQRRGEIGVVEAAAGISGAGFGANYCGRAGRDELDGSAIFANPAPGDDGVSVGWAIRFAEGGAKRRVSAGEPRRAGSAGKNRRYSERTDERTGGCGFRGSFARRPEHWSETRRGDSARSGGRSGRDSLRRADYDGGSADGGAYQRSDREIESEIAQDFHRGDARHAPGEKVGGSHTFPAGRARGVFRHVAGTGKFQGAFLAEFSRAG